MGQELKILTTIWPVVFGVVLCIGTSLCVPAFVQPSQHTLEVIDCRVFPNTGKKFCYFYNQFSSDGTSSSEWDQYGEACRRNEQYFQRTYNTSERVTKLSVNTDEEFTYINNSLNMRARMPGFMKSFLFGYAREWDDGSNKTFVIDVIGNLTDKSGVESSTLGLKSGYGLYYKVLSNAFSVEKYRDTQSFQLDTAYFICKAKAPSSAPLQTIILPPLVELPATVGPGRISTSGIPPGGGATVPGSIITSGIPHGSRATVSYRGVYFGKPWHRKRIRPAHASSTPPVRLTVLILVTVMLGSVNRSRAF